MNYQTGEELVHRRDGDAAGLGDIEIGAVLTLFLSLDDQIEAAGERFQLFDDGELITICTHNFQILPGRK